MAVAAIPLVFSSCASRTVDVAIAFDNDWRAGQESLTSNEPSLIRRTAVQTLQHATTEPIRLNSPIASSAERTKLMAASIR